MPEQHSKEVEKPPLKILLGRAIKLICPACGKNKLFSGIFRMHKKCENCQLIYEQEPGYFLGATYINYGVTVLSMTLLYLVLHFLVGISRTILIIPAFLYVLIFGTFFFRYARSFWLAIDLWIESISRQDIPGDD